MPERQESGNLYPNGYLKMVYDGNKDSNEAVVNFGAYLGRCSEIWRVGLVWGY